MPGLSRERLRQAGAYRADLRAREQRDAWHEAWEERAAIIEYEGNVPRAKAERWATECIRRVRGAL